MRRILELSVNEQSATLRVMTTTEDIVQMLIQERDRLSNAIEALQGAVKRRGRPPKTAAGVPIKPESRLVADVSRRKVVKRTMSAAGRKAIADAARRRWALIKAGKAESPFVAHRKKKAGSK